MNTIRRALAILSLIAAIPMGSHAWLASDTAFLANTIKNHEYENAEFKKASLLVDDFLERNKRLPTSQEMQVISPDFHFEIQGEVTKFPSRAKPSAVSLINRELTEIGSPPISTKHPYLLVDWGYDLPLFWASWAQRSNAYTDPARFYTLGTSTADVMLYGTATILLLCSALLLWHRPNPSINTDAAR